MLWKGRRASDNVVDQRALGGKSLGIGGLLIGAFVVYLMGGNPLTFLAQNMDSATQTQTRESSRNQRGPASTESGDPDSSKKEFVSVVLADTEDVWSTQFTKNGKTYIEPKLVLFNGAVQSACGRAQSSVGPFYCPADQRVYLDLSFFEELGRLGAPGEFAGAYVIAHEIGHHVQHLLGLTKGSRTNAESVRVELQADCLAGVWAQQTEQSKDVINNSDIDEALTAASAVGDDRLQQRSRGTVMPDSFTHGSSAQRESAFKRGYQDGRLEACL